MFIIDRPRKMGQTRCAGCTETWDNPNGKEEFFIWSIGYTDGKRDAVDAASMIPEPDTTRWATPPDAGAG